MKKVMKNSEMVNIVNGLVAMQERETKSGEKIFPGRIRVIYAIKKNKERLVSLLTPYEESRKELLEEYGTKADETVWYLSGKTVWENGTKKSANC